MNRFKIFHSKLDLYHFKIFENIFKNANWSADLRAAILRTRESKMAARPVIHRLTKTSKRLQYQNTFSK